MSQFEKIRFCGSFRDYQQRVLDRANQYLRDGKINIVAAPGSGKTVLGLELIRRLGERCLILSPTTAIREQWGERFREMFLTDKGQFQNLFSNDLHSIRLINSITYQALYAMMEKVSSVGEENETDCSDIDLLQTIRTHRIRTICLDEAHHLKNEWQRALEKFVSLLSADVRIISLTATPPYDSDGSEWRRYINICGEIDEEIFVPELVARSTLCPHQDYVYFNYPTQTETDAVNAHALSAALAVEEIGALSFLSQLCERINRNFTCEELFSAVKEYVALLVLFRHWGFEVNSEVIDELTARKGLPDFRMEYAETAIQFLLGAELLAEEETDAIVRILKAHTVYDKRRVTLVLTEKLKRMLVSSVGKLDSIRRIAASESAAMGRDLRMLILTDYIKKENVSKIATAEDFRSVNVVSIFETLRRADDEIRLGVLSGSLVILPDSVDLSAVKHKKQAIDGTRYCTVEFPGPGHTAVEFVGTLLKKGEIQILVGTKSLLGEGWDAPCINSLILASFVGSFVLSNQMRGRAIRIDPSNPDKTANIWHLVTVEPPHLLKAGISARLAAYTKKDVNRLTSCDFEVLKRRFDSFMGPNYSTGKIESGIERLTAITPPYHEQGIETINQKMLSMSRARGEIRKKWSAELAGARFEVTVDNRIPTEKKAPLFTFHNVALAMALFAAETALIYSFLRLQAQSNLFLSLVALAVQAAVAYLLYRLIKTVYLHTNPARSVKALGKAVFWALRECELISGGARVETEQDKELNYVSLQLHNASIHDQNVFNAAMTELLSPIENPRYLLIRKSIFGGYCYRCSFACPSALGKKKEYAAVLASHLKESLGRFEMVFTHKEDGRRLILRCRRRSYITYNHRLMNKKYKVSHWN